MGFKGFAQLGRRLELPGRDHDLRVTRLPFLQRSGDRRGCGVIGILDKHCADAGKEAHRFDRVQQLGRVLAQVACGHAGQAHFLLGGRTKEGGQHLLAFERNTHRVRAVDQQPGLAGVGAGEIALGLARAEFHAPVVVPNPGTA